MGSTEIRTIQRKVKNNQDYLIDYDKWLEAQDGKDIKDPDDLETNVRPILTPRDLAYWVHVDALYQAYLGAGLILLNTENDMHQKVYHFDPLLPYQNSSKQMGFAVFGGPHILSLVTEVAHSGVEGSMVSEMGRA